MAENLNQKESPALVSHHHLYLYFKYQHHCHHGIQRATTNQISVHSPLIEESGKQQNELPRGYFQELPQQWQLRHIPPLHGHVRRTGPTIVAEYSVLKS